MPEKLKDAEFLGEEAMLLIVEGNSAMAGLAAGRDTKKIGLENVRVYVSGQNLFSFNSFYKGWDPENEIGTGDSPSYYPVNSIYSFGFNFKF